MEKYHNLKKLNDFNPTKAKIIENINNCNDESTFESLIVTLRDDILEEKLFFEGKNDFRLPRDYMEAIVETIDKQKSFVGDILKESQNKLAGLLNDLNNALILFSKLDLKVRPINNITPIISVSSTLDSKIIKEERDENQLVVWLKYEKRPSFNLLYRGSRDGYTQPNFMSKVQGVKSIMIIIETTDGKRFGGFTENSLHAGDQLWKTDQKSFIFSLDDIKKFPVKTSEFAVICGPEHYIFAFGAGHDLYIHNACNLNKGSYIQAGKSYLCDPTMKQKHFCVKEIEAFNVL